MAVGPRLEQRQLQSLVMTPQLQQAIKLLQLSNLELAAFLEEEIEQNPLLEHEGAEDTTQQNDDAAASEGGEDGHGDETAILDSHELSDADTLPADNDAPLDVDYDNMLSGGEGAAESHVPTTFSDSGGGGGGEAPDLDQTLSREESLHDYLMAQFNIDITDPVDRMIGTHLADMLDEAGYFTGDLEIVAERMNCTIARVEETLVKLQNLEPSGVFARDLAECLAIQLRDRNRFDPAMAALLKNLDLLAKRDFNALRRACGVDAEDLAEMVDEIKALNPKPGLTFDTFVAQPVVPDVFVRPQAGGGWIIELNNDTLPRVLVNTRYYARIARTARNKEEKEYLSERFQSANWLVKALHQRANTILRVATEIVTQQEAFFTKGIRHLRPLILRDIATVIDMHESTVSRVTTNKYMGTPRGVFEMKYFFTSAVGRSDNADAPSAAAVRVRIKGLIDMESADGVLSDDRIVEVLRKEGVEIARRTVAKYREAMRIPSSVQRRREKTLSI